MNSKYIQFVQFTTLVRVFIFFLFLSLISILLDDIKQQPTKQLAIN